MKKIVWLVVFSMVILLTNSLPQDITGSEIDMIKGEICRRIKVKAVLINSPALKPVFEGKFYQVKLSREDPNGSIFGMGNLILVRVDNKFVSPEDIMTSKPMPRLTSLLKKSLILKNPKDAELIQQALDEIYPIKSISDKQARRVEQKGDQWILIRGKFFDKSKGFVIKTQEGRVTEVSYSLSIKL